MCFAKGYREVKLPRYAHGRIINTHLSIQNLHVFDIHDDIYLNCGLVALLQPHHNLGAVSFHCELWFKSDAP
jgi:hypothetical protein